MKKLLPYILILTIILGFSLPTTRVAAQPEGCYDKSNGLPVALDKATCEDAVHKEQGFYWWSAKVCTPPETLSQDNECVCKLPSVRKDNKCITPDVTTPPASTNEPLGTCLPKLAQNEMGPPQPIKDVTEKACKDKGGTWTVNGTIYNFLAKLPCDSSKDIPGCEGGQLTTFNPAEGNALGTYLNIILRIFIGICAVLAVIMIVVGGIEYMTSELPGNKEGGKDRITGAVFGLVLALSAYTILYQINPALLDTELTSLKNQEVEGVSIDEEPQTPDPITKKYPNGVTDGIDWDDSVGAIVSMPSGVIVNKGECTKVGQQNCTSTRGLSLTYIQTIKNNCLNCTLLVVNAGTEFWLHGGKNGFTSHNPRSPTVDLRLPDPALTNYIKSGTPDPKNPNRWTKDGISFLYETNHWHAGP